MRWIENRNIIIYLANNGIYPVAERENVAYYWNSSRLKDLLESYKIYQCFKRGGKWE